MTCKSVSIDLNSAAQAFHQSHTVQYLRLCPLERRRHPAPSQLDSKHRLTVMGMLFETPEDLYLLQSVIPIGDMYIVRGHRSQGVCTARYGC